MTAAATCVNLSDMKTATAGQIQRNLSRFLRWVEEGEEIEISERGRIVARIVPAENRLARPDWPDFVARARRVWGERPRGDSMSSIISEGREDRIE